MYTYLSCEVVLITSSEMLGFIAVKCGSFEKYMKIIFFLQEYEKVEVHRQLPSV